MNKIKLTVISLFAVVGVVSFVPSYAVFADAASDIQSGINSVGGNEGGNSVTLGTRIQTIVNILLYIIGAVAVVMIVIGGVRYTTSNGDSSAIKGAKDTIMYAVIGIVVAILAYAIVNFVIAQF